MKKTRLLFLFFIAIAIQCGLYYSLVFAQSSTQAIVLGIIPSKVTEGQMNTLRLIGDNLPLTPTIVLSRPAFLLPLQTIDVNSQQIRLTLPATVTAGTYKICLLSEVRVQSCAELRVDPAIQPQITSITPILVYNTEQADRRITVFGLNLGGVLTVTLGDHPLSSIETANLTSTIGTGVITTSIPVSFSPSTYPLTLILADGVALRAKTQVEVHGSIHPSVTAVSPQDVLQFPSSDVPMTISGQNLQSVSRIRIEASYSDNYCNEWYDPCRAIKISQSKIADLLMFSNFFNEVQEFNGVHLSFPDGSEVELPLITVHPRIAPWTFGAWFWWITIILLAFFFCRYSYNRSFQDINQVHLVNQTAPGNEHSMTIVGLGLIDSVIVLVLYLIVVPALSFWFSSNTVLPTYLTSYYYITLWLVSANLLLLYLFMRLHEQFDTTFSMALRYFLFFGLAISVFGLPFILTTTLSTEWGWLAELGLTGLIASSGAVGIGVARNRLERARHRGPSDSEVMSLIEASLYRKGTVAASTDLLNLPLDQVSRMLNRYYSDHRNTQGLIFSSVEQRLSFERRESIYALANRFFAIGNKEFATIPVLITESTLQSVIQRLQEDFAFVVQDQYTLTKSLTVFSLFRIVPLGLESVLPNPFPLIFYRMRQVMTSDHLEELRNLLIEVDAPARFALLVVFDEVTTNRARVHRYLGGVGRENAVVFGERNWLEILTRNLAVELALMEEIQQQVDLTIFSPFQTRGPTTGDMFYGREREIGQVLTTIDSGSVAILGARRIGKTSMLQAIQRVLLQRGKVLKYLDCYHINNYTALMRELAVRWKTDEWGGEYNKYTDFPRLVGDLQRQHPDAPIVFQMDEVDRLIVYDHQDGRDELLFRMFRSLAQEKRCQFVFSGERVILEQLANPRSCFFNFTTPFSLGLLDRETAATLVQKPMALIGVALEQPEHLLSLIYEQTDGHPNLIQSLCEDALKAISQTERRIFTVELLNKLCNNSRYIQRYQETFWSQATPLEKAVSVCIATIQPANKAGIRTALQQANFQATIQQLESALRYLTLSQLLVEDQGSYRIYPKKFGETLAAYPPEQWLQDFLAEASDE